ncbi:MAG: endolytic transglycosylase MltG [Thermodesulfobacteriota bacterium]|jgi:UPF0755 protein|nr:MAG: endolytic transglycosylase MltG [Thermodesulfobacteriota bacterium]
MKKVFANTTCLILTLGIPAFIGILLSFAILPPPHMEVVEVITIPLGVSLHEVTHLLSSKRIIRSQTLFNLLVRYRRADTQIKSGEYRLTNRMLPHEVLNKLIRGEQIKYSITIPEGLTVAQMALLYEKAGIAEQSRFISLSTDPNFIASLGIQAETLEGYLFPDTYKFIRNIGEKNIIRSMVQRFNEVYGEEFKKRGQELNLSQRDVIILASLIEKEAACPQERALISAVFYNRLKLHMQLQCDSTVIFGIKNFNGNLTKDDLKTCTPFNTYVYSGLPPTPIANPGLDSIKAALYPADVNYLFFVSRNDGTHYFSSTLAEHNQAVNKYQRRNQEE